MIPIPGISTGGGGLSNTSSARSGDVQSAFGDRQRTSGISSAPNWGVSQGAMIGAAVAVIALLVFLVKRK